MWPFISTRGTIKFGIFSGDHQDLSVQALEIMNVVEGVLLLDSPTGRCSGGAVV